MHLSQIPLLMFHHVGENQDASGKLMSISAAQFTRVLDQIEHKALRTTTFEALEKESLSQTSMKNTVILTFDDCSADLFDFAIPELLKRGMKACFYIPTAHIGKYNSWDTDEFGTIRTPIMNQAQLLKLSVIGMEIGSHAHRHIHLDKENDCTIVHELEQSKVILGDLLGKPIYSLAWPYSAVPKNYAAIMKQVGFNYGLCIYRGNADLFTLRRIGIHESDREKSIAKKLSRLYYWQRRLYDWLKGCR